jgi:hypothetical protein
VLRALVDCRDRQIQKARIQFDLRVQALERGADDGGLEELKDSRQYRLLAGWRRLFILCEEGLSRSQRQVLTAHSEVLPVLQEAGLDAIVEIMLEGGLNGQIETEVKKYELYEHLVAIKGIGPGLAAKLMALIDITKPNTVSQLWRHAGYGLSEYWVDEKGKVVAPKVGKQFKERRVRKEQPDGTFKVEKEKYIEAVVPEPEESWHLETVRDRRIKDWVCPYNNRLKTCLYLVARGLMRKGNPYRIVYDVAREKYDTAHPEWSKGHQNDAARRKLIKVFLSHLWEVWRKLEGLPTRRLYVQEKLGHTTIHKPEDFGWAIL